MSTLRSSRYAVGVLWGAFFALIAFASAVVAQDWQPDRQTPAQFLEDGMDAAADHATDTARRIFAELIAEYPASPEALRAKHALAALDSGEVSPDDRAAVQADAAERTTRYRRAFLVDVGDRVFFAETTATIGGRARSMIENQARWLKARPDLTVTVVGRADDGGDPEAAIALSLQRAQAVRDRLVAFGIDGGRIEVRAAGSKDRVAMCDTALCQAQNRNAEVFINDLRGDAGLQLDQPFPAASRSLLGGPYRARADQASQ